MENGPFEDIFNWTWVYSIAILVYQRVYLYSDLTYTSWNYQLISENLPSQKEISSCNDFQVIHVMSSFISKDRNGNGSLFHGLW